jgi:hypothetical protein
MNVMNLRHQFILGPLFFSSRHSTAPLVTKKTNTGSAGVICILLHLTHQQQLRARARRVRVYSSRVVNAPAVQQIGFMKRQPAKMLITWRKKPRNSKPNKALKQKHPLGCGHFSSHKSDIRRANERGPLSDYLSSQSTNTFYFAGFSKRTHQFASCFSAEIGPRARRSLNCP